MQLMIPTAFKSYTDLLPVDSHGMLLAMPALRSLRAHLDHNYHAFSPSGHSHKARNASLRFYCAYRLTG